MAALEAPAGPEVAPEMVVLVAPSMRVQPSIATTKINAP
jgi:hypothetical protein